MARADLEYYSEKMGFTNAPYHKEWYELLQPKNDSQHFSPLREHPAALKRFHLEGPRKHAKSQIVAINYVLWLIGNYPNIHISIVSKTGTLSSDTLSAIKTTIESDSKYYDVFGNLKPKNSESWNDSDIIIKRNSISKFPTVHATGIYGPLTGGGNDLIIADDIIDEENVVTSNQIEKSSRWLHKVLLTTLFSWGAAFVIGTRWSYNDLYSELLKKWPNKIYKAIIDEEKGIVLWPEEWPLERLRFMKDDIGTLFFNCQYQNDPSGMEGIILKSEWLHNWELPPSGLKYAGVDPKGEGDDLFAISTFQHNPQLQKLYLHDVWAENVSQYEGLIKLQQLHELHHYAKIFFESNALQKSLLNHPELKGLPTVPTLTDTNKERRFISMSSHYQSARVEVNPLLNNPRSEFWNEWVQFPKGAHDCALDSCEVVTRNLIKRRLLGLASFGEVREKT